MPIDSTLAGPIWAAIVPRLSASRIHGCSRRNSSAGSEGKFTAFLTAPFLRKSRTVAAVSKPTNACASSVDAAMCGVLITCGNLASDQSVGGSFSKTSRAAPATMPVSMACRNACSSIKSPLAVLTIRMPTLQRLNRSALNKW
jgi:hypothetical protein